MEEERWDDEVEKQQNWRKKLWVKMDDLMDLDTHCKYIENSMSMSHECKSSTGK